MTPNLLRPCNDSPGGVELSPGGHDFVLGEDYESAILGLQRESGKLTGCSELRLRCLSFPVADEEFGAGMPPVVSRISQNGNERFLLHLLPNQVCFEGHFPGRPILAGVIQLHWAVKLAQTCLADAGSPREILRLKYHNIVVPPRFVELQLETSDRSEDSFRVQFNVHSPSGTHAQGTLVFAGSC